MPGLDERRSVELPAAGSSASTARGFVGTTLSEWALNDLLDAAELATSELVTNAVLHARTDIRLVLAREGHGVRVEVWDRSSLLPSPRGFRADTTTGRGMSLVRALAQDTGVDVQDDGKTVWFTLPRLDAVEVSEEGDLLAAWDLDDLATRPVGQDQTVVLLRGLPVQLVLAAQQHHESALRELVLAHRLTRSGVDGVWDGIEPAARALATLTGAVDAVVRADVGDPRAATDDRSAAVGPEPPRTVDASVVAGPGLGDDLQVLQDTLDEADRMAADGLLLVRPALPEVVALRDWCCDQVRAQTTGTAPARWRSDQVGTEDVVHGPQRWNGADVAASTRAMIAADDRNRILAVSAPAEQLLGWPAAVLVGRRIVTIIPTRYREAHIAGFTRHLLTGETKVLGAELKLPVLRLDGSEVVCHLLIEKVSDDPAVYLSVLTEAEDP